ncbi:MAG TPA: hypothetical protein VGC09_00455 [Rhodopila sp.]
MHLYIANASYQTQVFIYRLLESKTPRQQPIRRGHQIKITGDLSTEDIDYVVGQHRKYGLISTAEVDANRTHTALIYSVGKPVPPSKVEAIMARNKEVLQARGKQIRKEAAMAEAVRVEKDLTEQGARPESLLEMNTEIVEQNHDDRDSTPAVAEGFRVTRNANPDGSPINDNPKRGRGGRRRAA